MIYNSVKLKDICSFQEGYVNPSQTVHKYFNGNIKWLRATDINDTYVYTTGRTLTAEGYNSAGKSAKLFEPNTIAISKSGTIGRVGIIKDYMCGNRAVINIVPNKELVDLMYLYYFLKANRLTLENMAQGSVQKNLYIFILEEFNIPLPPLELQKKIGLILEKLDKKIEINNRININLHELIKSMYQDFINSLNDTNSVKCEVKKIAKCILGGTPSRVKDEYWNGNINWINSGKINKFRIIEASEYITDIGLSKSSTTLLPKRTTVLAITGATLGQVSRLEIDSCANQSVIGIVPFDSKYNNYIYLTTLNNIDELALRQTGGAQQHINKNDVETFGIIVPNDIDVFDERVKVLFDKISLNCFENKNLEKLRDTLLPKLMNSEIDLENLEI